MPEFELQLTYVLFDVLEVCGVSKLLVIPVHALEPVVQHWVVVADGTKIAFLLCVRSVNSSGVESTYKVLYIDSIEANQGGVKADVQLCHLLTKDIRTFAIMKQLLEFIESTEHRWDVLVVCFLVGSKPSFVHACIQIRLHPVRDLVDPLAQVFGI